MGIKFIDNLKKNFFEIEKSHLWLKLKINFAKEENNEIKKNEEVENIN